MKKNFKVLSLIAIGSALCLGVTAFAISNPGVLSSQFLYRKEANVSAGKIVFNKDKTTRSGVTTYTPSKTQGGDDIICKIFYVDSTQSSGHMGALTVGSEIHFYEADGVTEYMFEDIDRIKFEFSGTSSQMVMKGFYDDGSAYSQNISNGASTRDIPISGGNVSHLWIQVTAFANPLDKITLTYNCQSKSQTGAEISTPATKLDYDEGSSFDPTGMIVKAVYDNGMKLPTTNYRITPSGALKASDTYVSIECGGYVIQQPITVKAAASSLSGTYNSSTSGERFEFNEDGTGIYYYYDAGMNITYSITDTNITFTFVSYVSSATYDDFNRHRLFNNSDTENNTGRITGENTFVVKIQGVSLTNHTFTKAA